jgi:hypothetical protein
MIGDRELEKALEKFRYYDKMTDESKMSGFPQDWIHNSVYENTPNPDYDDMYFNYDFPRSYGYSPWVRRNLKRWISANTNRNIKYIRRLNNYDYEMYNVRIVNVDLDAKKVRFRVVY